MVPPKNTSLHIWVLFCSYLWSVFYLPGPHIFSPILYPYLSVIKESKYCLNVVPRAVHLEAQASPQSFSARGNLNLRHGKLMHFWMLTCLICVLPQLTGQPVLIGGTMGTCSYVLTGTEQGMTETFGTTCHGAVSYKNRSSLWKALFSIVIALHFDGKIYLKVKVRSLSRVQLFVIPWAIACKAPLSMGFSRQEHWSGLPFPSPGDLRELGIEPRSPTLQADSVPSEPPGKPLVEH